MSTCHDHNLSQPLPEQRPFGIRVRLRRGDPFRKLLGELMADQDALQKLVGELKGFESFKLPSGTKAE